MNSEMPLSPASLPPPQIQGSPQPHLKRRGLERDFRCPFVASHLHHVLDEQYDAQKSFVDRVRRNKITGIALFERF